MQDTDYLNKNSRIYLDELIDKEFKPYLKEAIKYSKPHKLKPFQSYVTLDLIQYVGESFPRKYISKLINEQEKYGYLYYLYHKNLIISLRIGLEGSNLILNNKDFDEIMLEIHKIAGLFFSSNDPRYNITRLELMYFYTLLVNPGLTWISLDYLIKGNRYHSYLIASPKRLIK